MTKRLGLMVMGGDLRSRGRGFESQHRILDGHFSHLLYKLYCLFVESENNEKEARYGPFLKKYAKFLKMCKSGPLLLFSSFQKLLVNKCSF